MKIPAIRAQIGTWDYYVTTLTFKQVSEYVSKIDDQLHKSEGLKDLIQRSITENYLSIKEYILKQPEMFFNSLVLAVYDNYPNWREIEFKYNDFETYQMGLLEFPGMHKIFPVDGQHRVEGIKAALVENADLKDQRISVIFIGHSNKLEGKEKTRRLFTTLNRYAKPVTTDDIIALDEDDAAAILTRELLEEYDLFSGSRVIYAKQKAIPTSNQSAITSIITLYQANIELYKDFYYTNHQKRLTKPKLEEQLKFRLPEKEFAHFKDYCLSYWDAFKIQPILRKYLNSNEIDFSLFRNSITGGNLIFRPIGFLPLVKASIRIKQQKKINYKTVFAKFSAIDFNINKKPWTFVLWNPTEKKMVMNTSTIAEKLLIYLFDPKILTRQEISKLQEGYAGVLSIENKIKIAKILDNLR